MGFWSSILGPFNGQTAHFTPRVTRLGMDELQAVVDPSSLTPAQMWKTQPHFRTVVAFMARNIAQLGLHSFERVNEGDRRRDRDSTLARTLRSPDGDDGSVTEYELLYGLVGDLCLYDRAYWWAAPSSETASGWMIRRIPPTWVEPHMRTPWDLDYYDVVMDRARPPVRVPKERILSFPGFHPGNLHGSSPTVDALKDTLKEQIEAARYRSQVWRRGGRVSSVLQRPRDAPDWSDAARKTFSEDWYAKYTGRGEKAGGTPILEDGMTLQRIDFNAQEQQFVEAAKLSLVTVASAFHINPTMIGQNEGANYSNVREFRKMLYGDTLGPLVAQVESRINTFLLQRMAMDPTRFYVEFNIEEKLQGNFEEQATALQAATGAPWMTRNEARGLRNLSAVDGGDELVTPLNVLIGGQSSPVEEITGEAAGPPATKANAKAPFHVKAEPTEADADAATEVLRTFFARQSKVVLSRMGAKGDQWWDEERWDRELGVDLYAFAVDVSARLGAETMATLGFDPGDYDVERTQKFLKAIAAARAGSINKATRRQVQAALDGDLEEGAAKATAEGVFEEAGASRAVAAGVTLATTIAAFAVTEAAKQVSAPETTKTWVVTSRNPRPSHARMDGDTVPVEEPFSNGMNWPGDPSGGVDEVAGCSCVVDITVL